MKRNILYFDNAATSWPKPEATILAVELCLWETGGSPGRSGHSLSIDAGRVIFNAREALAGLLGIDDPLRIVLTKNATEAINIAVFGFLKPGGPCDYLVHGTQLRYATPAGHGGKRRRDDESSLFRRGGTRSGRYHTGHQEEL